MLVIMDLGQLPLLDAVLAVNSESLDSIPPRIPNDSAGSEEPHGDVNRRFSFLRASPPRVDLQQ